MPPRGGLPRTVKFGRDHAPVGSERQDEVCTWIDERHIHGWH